MKRSTILLIVLIVLLMTAVPAYADSIGMTSESYAAPVYVSYSGSPQELVNQLVGESTDIIVEESSINVIGTDDGIVLFDSFNAGQLSDATKSMGPYEIALKAGVKFSSMGSVRLGDSDLVNLINTTYGRSYTSNDASGIEFDFTVAEGIRSVSFNFIYGTGEYPGWVGTYVDGAAIFVDGVNYAYYDNGGTQELVTTEFGDPFMAGSSFSNLPYSGILRPYKVNGLLNESQSVHHVKIVVHDTNDNGVDSDILVALMAGSTSTACGITEVNAPEINTESASAITTESATFSGEIITIGEPASTDHGFVWSTASGADLSDESISLGVPAVGPFSSSVSGLILDTAYYYRSYVTNGNGTIYGSEKTFTTLSIPNPVITLSPFDSENWTNASITVLASVDKGTLNATEHTFDDNGNFTFSANAEDGTSTSEMVAITTIDKQSPVIQTGIYETEWTHTPVTVTVSDSVNDGLSPITFNTSNHEFTANGSFEFVAIDEAGNGDSLTVFIDNIDNDVPEVGTNNTDYTWKTKDITVALDYADAGGSGLASSQYQITDSASTPDIWQDYAGSLILSDSGTFYVHYQVSDHAGNTRSSSYGPYQLDKESPVISVTPESGNWARSHSVVATVTDATSGLAEAFYQWSADGVDEAGWQALTSGATLMTPEDMSGAYRLYIKAVDAAGNQAALERGSYNLDNDVPEVGTNNTDYTWKTKDITVALDYADAGGSGLASSQYQITDSASTPDIWQDYAGSLILSDSGTFYVHYQVSDHAGNTRSSSYGPYQLDKESPVISVTPESGNWARSHSVVATVTDATSGLAEAFYQWSADGVDEAGWQALTSGATLMTPEDMSGAYRLYIKAVDAAGNQAALERGSYNLDNDVPEVGTNNTDYTWKTKDITVALDYADAGGSGLASSQYQITDSASTPDIWQDYAGSLILSDSGTFYVHYQVSDHAGNTRSSSYGPYQLDKESPVISVTPESGNWARSHSVVATVTDATSGLAEAFYQWSADGVDEAGWQALTSGATLMTPEDMSGAYRLYIKAVDAAGNQAALERGSYNLDNDVPEVGTNNTDYTWKTKDITVALDYADAGGSGLASSQYQITDSASTPDIWQDYAGSLILSDSGTFYVHYQVSDHAGNTRSSSYGPYQLDKESPVISVTPESGNWARSHSVVATVTDATSGLAEAFYQWSADGVNEAGWQALTSGATLMTPEDMSGAYRLYIKAVDAAGNQAALERGSYNLDNVAPVMTVTGNSEDWINSPVNLSWSVADNLSYLRAELPDGTLTTETSGVVTVDENGKYAFGCKDEAGNQSMVEVVVSTIDYVKPEIIVSGNLSLRIDQGEPYVDAGATVADDLSGLANNLTVVNPVDTRVIGNYKVTYDIVDRAGNDADQKSRSVEVVKALTPIIDMIDVESEYKSVIKASIDNLGAADDLLGYGLAWNTSGTPTLEDQHVALSLLVSPGPYTITMEGLDDGTTYYVRAYGVDSTGIRYSEERTLTTPRVKSDDVTEFVNQLPEPVVVPGEAPTVDLIKKITSEEISYILKSELFEGDDDETTPSLEFVMGTPEYTLTLDLDTLKLPGDDEGKNTIPETSHVQVKLKDVTQRVPEEVEAQVVAPVITYEAQLTTAQSGSIPIHQLDGFVERTLVIPTEEESTLDVDRLVAVKISLDTGEYVPVPSVITENEDGTLTVSIQHDQLGTYTVVENNQEYPFVQKDSWVAETAEIMCRQLMLEDVFREQIDFNLGIKRAEVAAMMLKILGANVNLIEPQQVFADLSEDNQWYNTVNQAVANGLLSGYGDGTIRPESVISRVEAAAVISRLVEKLEKLQLDLDPERYLDDKAIGVWAKARVYAMNELGIFVGYEEGDFRPANEISIGESMSALYRMMRYLEFIN
jgi:hypothetical protein